MPAIVSRGGQAFLGAVPLRQERIDAENEQKFNSFEDAFARAHLCYEKQHAKLLNSLRPPSLAERISNPSSGASARVSGRDRLAKIRRTLDSFGLERSEMQRQFHEDMIGACARLIFKDDLEAELDDLLLELGVEELHSEFMAITPRRFGKTYSVAMFVVAMMHACEGLEQAIFSTGRRASQKLLELVYKLMKEIPGMCESITKHNVETIWIRGPGGEDRKVFSYPSSMSSCEDVLDKMIKRLSDRRVRIVPVADVDIEASDALKSTEIKLALKKRDGFPVEGAVLTENEAQADRRRRSRNRRLKKQAETEAK